MKRTDMKRFSPALLLFLNGCFSCGRVSEVQGVDPELKVYQPVVPLLADRHGSDRLDAVAPGAWVKYAVTRDGGEVAITIGAVRVEDKALWIEVVEEGDPRKVSQRRVTFDGQVTAARFQEIPASGPASEIADQALSPAEDEVRETPASVTEESRKVALAGKSIDVLVFRSVFRDDSVGREFEREEGWSKEVPPLLEHREGAGLVSRKSPGESVKLVDWGTGYVPLIR
jgi:hypothetical protein